MLALLLQIASPLVPPAALEVRAAGLEGAAASQAEAQAALGWVELGDGARALAATDRALARALPLPAEAELRSIRALANRLLGDLAAARIDLDRALAAQPDDALFRLASSTLARDMGEDARARADLAVATRLAPDDPFVLLEVADGAARDGRTADAVAALRRVLAGADEAAWPRARAGLAALGEAP